ncbi:MAG: MFS transporter [Acidimicrobiales bacterium]
MSTAPSEAEEESSVWRSRDFRLVFAGSLVNNIGDWMLLVALPVYVFTKSRSGAATAAVFVIELVIGVLLGPYGGSLADRWDLRRTLIATNVLQAVTLLPLLAVARTRLWPAFVVVALQSALKQVNDPASFALLPRVVKTSQLVAANAAHSASFSVARLIGSPAGGIAVAFGGLTSVVVIDSVTFAAVAVAMGLVRTPTGTLLAPDGETGRQGGGVRVGLREIKARPPLMAYVVVQALAQLAFAMFPILFIVFVVDELHGGGSQIGIIRGMAAFGGIVAALIVPRWARKRSAPWLMMWGYLGLALSAALFINAPAVSTALWLYLVLFSLTGLPNATSQIGSFTTAQQLCPPHVLGRLNGILSATGAVGAAIGSIGTGLLVDHFAVIPLFNGQALGFFLCGMVSYLTIVRRLPQPAADEFPA